MAILLLVRVRFYDIVVNNHTVLVDVAPVSLAPAMVAGPLGAPRSFVLPCRLRDGRLYEVCTVIDRTVVTLGVFSDIREAFNLEDLLLGPDLQASEAHGGLQLEPAGEAVGVLRCLCRESVLVLL